MRIVSENPQLYARSASAQNAKKTEKPAQSPRPMEDNMYILYKRIRKKSESDRELVIEAEILDPSQYTTTAAIVKERNLEKTAVEYAIAQVDDDSLTAFLARDRRYDLNKFDDTAAEIRQRLESAMESVFKLDVFYRAARDSKSADDTTQTSDR